MAQEMHKKNDLPQQKLGHLYVRHQKNQEKNDMHQKMYGYLSLFDL